MNSYSVPWRRASAPGAGFPRQSAARIGGKRSGNFSGGPGVLMTLRSDGSTGESTVDATREEVAGSPDERESLDPAIARSRVEALLLIAKSPLNYRKIASLAGLEDATQARTLVTQLNELYDSQGRGFRIEQIAGGSRMMTRSVVAPWLRRLGVLAPAIRLSWPIMETLAVVAYRQDVTRADVESVRGVACGEILRQLMQLDLVRISGRSEDLGRPYLYGTTKRFLKICGLASINALPAIDSRSFCDDLSGSPEIGTVRDDSDIPPPTTSAANADAQVPKESDVSLAVTDALATDSVLSHFATGVADPHGESLDAAQTLGLKLATPVGGDPRAVIEDEEDDLFEKGLEVDDDDVDDVDDDDDDDDVDDVDDDDWDDDDDDDDDDDNDDDEIEADEADDDEEDDDDSWEEVDDDEADEEWDDEDEEDDDWGDDNEEEGDEDDDVSAPFRTSAFSGRHGETQSQPGEAGVPD